MVVVKTKYDSKNGHDSLPLSAFFCVVSAASRSWSSCSSSSLSHWLIEKFVNRQHNFPLLITTSLHPREPSCQIKIHFLPFLKKSTTLEQPYWYVHLPHFVIAVFKKQIQPAKFKFKTTCGCGIRTRTTLWLLYLIMATRVFLCGGKNCKSDFCLCFSVDRRH